MGGRWPEGYPGVHWFGQEEENAVLDVLRRRAPFRYYGPSTPTYADSLEEGARCYYGVRHALAVNSGSGALTTAMAALDVGPGWEVIVPAFMWVSTVAAVVLSNAIPVLCEVNDSLNMDAHDLERKITSRTKLIVVVHMAGVPADMGPIMSVANARGIPVLEDCAQCNGGSYGGQKVGTFGAMGVFSLQLNKNITAGEGGLLITNDDTLYHRAFAAHDWGQVRVDGRLEMPGPEAAMWGQGRRMGELAAAVACAQMQKLPAIVDRMRASKQRIKAGLEGLPGLRFRRVPDPDGDTGPFLVLLFDDEEAARAACRGMHAQGLHGATVLAEYGMHIYSNIPPLVAKTPLSAAGNPWSLRENAESVYSYGKGACPRSDELFARSVILSVPSCLTEEQEQWAVRAIRAAVAPARLSSLR